MWGTISGKNKEEKVKNWNFTREKKLEITVIQFSETRTWGTRGRTHLQAFQKRRHTESTNSFTK